MDVDGGTKEKECVSLKGSKPKGIDSEKETLGKFTREPHCLSCLSTLKQRLLYSGVEHWDVALMLGLEEIQSQSGETFL